MSQPNTHCPDLRETERSDRRRHPRSGRRASDPHASWRKIAWLFAAYAFYLSVRSLPQTLKKYLARVRPIAI